MGILLDFMKTQENAYTVLPEVSMLLNNGGVCLSLKTQLWKAHLGIKTVFLSNAELKQSISGST